MDAFKRSAKAILTSMFPVTFDFTKKNEANRKEAEEGDGNDEKDITTESNIRDPGFKKNTDLLDMNILASNMPFFAAKVDYFSQVPTSIHLVIYSFLPPIMLIQAPRIARRFKSLPTHLESERVWRGYVFDLERCLEPKLFRLSDGNHVETQIEIAPGEDGNVVNELSSSSTTTATTTTPTSEVKHVSPSSDIDDGKQDNETTTISAPATSNKSTFENWRTFLLYRLKHRGSLVPCKENNELIEISLQSFSRLFVSIRHFEVIWYDQQHWTSYHTDASMFKMMYSLNNVWWLHIRGYAHLPKGKYRAYWRIGINDRTQIQNPILAAEPIEEHKDRAQGTRRQTFEDEIGRFLSVGRAPSDETDSNLNEYSENTSSKKRIGLGRRPYRVTVPREKKTNYVDGSIEDIGRKDCLMHEPPREPFKLYEWLIGDIEVWHPEGAKFFVQLYRTTEHEGFKRTFWADGAIFELLAK